MVKKKVVLQKYIWIKEETHFNTNAIFSVEKDVEI